MWNTTITNVGATAILDATLGSEALTFTRVMVGKGERVTPKEATSVANYVASLPLNSVTPSPDGVQVVVSNPIAHVNNFLLSEFALYGRLGSGPERVIVYGVNDNPDLFGKDLPYTSQHLYLTINIPITGHANITLETKTLDLHTWDTFAHKRYKNVFEAHAYSKDGDICFIDGGMHVCKIELPRDMGNDELAILGELVFLGALGDVVMFGLPAYRWFSTRYAPRNLEYRAIVTYRASDMARGGVVFPLSAYPYNWSNVEPVPDTRNTAWENSQWTFRYSAPFWVGDNVYVHVDDYELLPVDGIGGDLDLRRDFGGQPPHDEVSYGGVYVAQDGTPYVGAAYGDGGLSSFHLGEITHNYDINFKWCLGCGGSFTSPPNGSLRRIYHIYHANVRSESVIIETSGGETYILPASLSSPEAGAWNQVPEIIYGPIGTVHDVYAETILDSGDYYAMVAAAKGVDQAFYKDIEHFIGSNVNLSSGVIYTADGRIITPTLNPIGAGIETFGGRYTLGNSLLLLRPLNLHSKDVVIYNPCIENRVYNRNGTLIPMEFH